MSNVTGPRTGLNIEQRRRARRLVKKSMVTFYEKAQFTAVYSQGPARFSGIRQHKRAYKGEYPPISDCSSSSTWAYWDATRRYKLKDFVNGASWEAGYTGTMQNHGKRVFKGRPRFATARMMVGDAVFYGDQGGGIAAHVAIYIGNGLVISHGSHGVHLLRWDYREVNEVRRYIR